MTLEISRQISENTQISNFVNIRPEGAEVFHVDGLAGGWTDRRTDMTKLIVAFRNFANAPKNWIHEETGSILNSENYVLPSATRHGNDHSRQGYEFATCLVRQWNPRGMKVYEHKKTGSS
jgi:hypothetical protein